MHLGYTQWEMQEENTGTSDVGHSRFEIQYCTFWMLLIPIWFTKKIKSFKSLSHHSKPVWLSPSHDMIGSSNRATLLSQMQFCKRWLNLSLKKNNRNKDGMIERKKAIMINTMIEKRYKEKQGTIDKPIKRTIYKTLGQQL